MVSSILSKMRGKINYVLLSYLRSIVLKRVKYTALYYKALRMTLLIGVCFLQPNIMVFKDLPKSFLMQIKGISCEYESKILRTVQSAIPCCTMQYCSWLKVMSSSKETYEFCCQKILKITGVENLHIITIFSCKKTSTTQTN